MKWLGVVVAAAAILFGSAGVASADEQSYLRRLDASGVGYYDNSASSRLAAGHVICDGARHSGNPRTGFNFVSNAMVSQQLIDIAQQELCPDTL